MDKSKEGKMQLLILENGSMSLLTCPSNKGFVRVWIKKLGVQNAMETCNNNTAEGEVWEEKERNGVKYFGFEQ